MDDATERRILYAMCLVVVALALIALNQGLKELDYRVIGVALALIGTMVVTAIAVWRSGRAGGETGYESEEDEYD